METCPKCNNANIHQWIDFNGSAKTVVTVCINCGWRYEEKTELEKVGDDATK